MDVAGIPGHHNMVPVTIINCFATVGPVPIAAIATAAVIEHKDRLATGRLTAGPDVWIRMRGTLPADDDFIARTIAVGAQPVFYRELVSAVPFVLVVIGDILFVIASIEVLCPVNNTCCTRRAIGAG